jgi:hypothetical protein
MPRSAWSEQLKIAVPSAPRATNAPGSSRRTVAAPKKAQLWRVPVVIRMPIVPCGPPGVRFPRATTFIEPLSRRTTPRTSENELGASRLVKVKLAIIPCLVVHPGIPAPAGAKTADGDACSAEKTSMVMPPGVPVAGSSGLPTAGNGKLGSRDTKRSRSTPLAERFRTTRVPSIGCSRATA